MSAIYLENKDGITLVIGLLMASGAMCPKCGFGTRVTSKKWARCKKCGERVERVKMSDISAVLDCGHPGAPENLIKGNSRPAFMRMLLVATEIRNSLSITAFELADKLNVCHKTICRDIDFLKDLGAPIYFKHDIHSWVWNPLLPVPWYFGGTIKNPKLTPTSGA